MCYAIFIGTAQLQQTSEFVAGLTDLYLEQPTIEQLNALKGKFTQPHIYYVGSTSGCSCDFEFHSEWFNDPEWQDSKPSPQALLNLLNTLTTDSPVEYYCCWDGDWEEPIEHTRALRSTDYSLENYFELIEQEFIRFEQQEPTTLLHL